MTVQESREMQKILNNYDETKLKADKFWTELLGFIGKHSGSIPNAYLIEIQKFAAKKCISYGKKISSNLENELRRFS